MIKDCALAAGNRETGGILLGSYGQDGNNVTVSLATRQPRDSQSGRTWFQRGARGLKALLQRRWKSGEYYVGEWHSHPGSEPAPSATDIEEIEAISRQTAYQCPKPLLVIAGTSARRRINLSVSVFHDRNLVRLRLARDTDELWLK